MGSGVVPVQRDPERAEALLDFHYISKEFTEGETAGQELQIKA
jgi:hypothetical protein